MVNIFCYVTAAEFLDIVFFYKAVNNLVFIDSEALPATRQSTRSTRSSSSNAITYIPKRCRTVTYQRSFFTRACSTWDVLPAEFRLHAKQPYFWGTLATDHIRTKGLERVKNQRGRMVREDHVYGASRLPKTSENDCFAVYAELRTSHISLASFKGSLLQYYNKALDLYDVDDNRTWRTICPRCNIARTLLCPPTCCF